MYGVEIYQGMLRILLGRPSVLPLAIVSCLASSANGFEEEAFSDLVVYLGHFEELGTRFVPPNYLLNPS